MPLDEERMNQRRTQLLLDTQIKAQLEKRRGFFSSALFANINGFFNRTNNVMTFQYKLNQWGFHGNCAEDESVFNAASFYYRCTRFFKTSRKASTINNSAGTL